MSQEPLPLPRPRSPAPPPSGPRLKHFQVVPELDPSTRPGRRRAAATGKHTRPGFPFRLDPCPELRPERVTLTLGDYGADPLH